MRLALTLIVLCAGCDRLFNVEHVAGVVHADANGLPDDDGGDDAGLSAGFVQAGDITSSSAMVVLAPFASAEQAGDMNIVFIAWTTQASAISTVSDQHGNTYAPVVAPLYMNNMGQAVYLASDIAAGTNSVIVAFTLPTDNIDVRVAEYQDLGDPDMSTSTAAVGTSVAAGAVTSSTAHSLLVAGFHVSGAITAPGAGCIQRRVSGFGNSLEDCENVIEGPVQATATQDQNGAYIAQSVLFALP